MTTHVVAPGECLSSIALRHGFRDFRTIYDHPKNAAFRRLRPNPHLVHPGDEVFIPDPEPKWSACATGARHRFRVAASKKWLRLVFRDVDGRPIANAPFELVVGGRSYEGRTDEGGALAARVPAQAEEGRVSIAGHVWPLRIGHLNPIEDAPDDGVSGVQARLRNLGYDPGPIDGEMGPRTRAAIRAFQRRHPPLVVDGVCGPKTRAKLVLAHEC